jgi:hypothetical protein
MKKNMCVHKYLLVNINIHIYERKEIHVQIYISVTQYN